MRRSIALGLAMAVVGGAGTLAHVAIDPRRALFAWIAAYGFGVSIALGALLLVMIMYVTHARWFVAVRPLAMAVASTLPLFAVLFVPIALGMRSVYPWADAGALAHADDGASEHLRTVLEHQRAYMNPPFFLVRAVLCLGAWSALALLLERPRPWRVRLSAAGIPIVAVTLSIAAFDWLMSVNAGWVSNAFGVYLFAGGLSGALGLLVVLTWAAQKAGVVPAELARDHYHALGRLLLMSVIFWAYIGFFQFMLVWIADLPHEVTFYAARVEGDFDVVSMVLVHGHFLAPFLVLLVRETKRRAAVLAVVGAWMVVMHAVDLEWQVLPAFTRRVHPLDVAPFLAVFGAALAFGALRFFARPKPLEDDPALTASLEYESP